MVADALRFGFDFDASSGGVGAHLLDYGDDLVPQDVRERGEKRRGPCPIDECLHPGAHLTGAPIPRAGMLDVMSMVRRNVVTVIGVRGIRTWGIVNDPPFD